MITKDKNIVDVIIVSYGNPEMTIDCVESLRSTTKASLNIIIVDNASSDDTVRILKDRLKDVSIIENAKNLGYAGAVNAGAEHCTSAHLLISNNDVIYKDDVVDGLFSDILSNQDIGVIGPGQEYADGSWQISHGDFPGVKLALKHIFFIEGFSNILRKLNRRYFRFSGGLSNTGYVDGAVMLVRRDIFEQVNGFDIAFTFYSEETDLCYRVKRTGFRVVNNSKYVVTHLRGGANNFGNLKKENIQKLVDSKVQFCQKHYSNNQTNIYIRIEKFYSFSFMRILSLIGSISKGELKARIDNKVKVMSFFYNAWAEVERK